MPDPYLVQNPRAAWRVYDGEAVIISPEDSKLHTLNSVGTIIWEAADGKSRVSAVVARVCDEFDVQPEVAAEDAQVFIESLCQHGLLMLSEVPREEYQDERIGKDR